MGLDTHALPTFLLKVRLADGDPWSTNRDFAPECLQLKALSSWKVNADKVRHFYSFWVKMSVHRTCAVELGVFLVLFVALSHCCML